MVCTFWKGLKLGLCWTIDLGLGTFFLYYLLNYFKKKINKRDNYYILIFLSIYYFLIGIISLYISDLNYNLFYPTLQLLFILKIQIIKIISTS